MNKSDLRRQYADFDRAVGVTFRAMAQLSDAHLDFRPAPEMRSARELLAHVFSEHLTHAKAVARGRLGKTDNRALEKEGLSQTTVKALIRWAKRRHRETKKAFEKTPESRLQGDVRAWYGKFPGWRVHLFCFDEHWHHRGQFYAYLRLLGIKPVFLYDY